MKVEYINPFYRATKDVFNLMLNLEPEKGQLKVVGDMIPSKDANVMLGVTGDLRGTILFSFPKDMTLAMVKTMCGMEFDTIDSFVSSALGEIANIIGGNAATFLAENNYICDIVPPQIFIGEYKSMSMANKKAILLPLSTTIGDFDIHIFLEEN